MTDKIVATAHTTTVKSNFPSFVLLLLLIGMHALQAWAEFKGKLTDAGRSDPASWKTRLRCALNKSPEFREVTERSQLDISEPYKVYLLVPISEQGSNIPSSHTVIG